MHDRGAHRDPATKDVAEEWRLVWTRTCACETSPFSLPFETDFSLHISSGSAMFKKLRFGLLAFCLALAACGGDDTSSNNDAGTDAAVETDGGSNSNSGTDGGQTDAGTDTGMCDEVAPSVTVTPASPVAVAYDAGSTVVSLEFSEPVTGVEPMAFTTDSGATIESVGGSGTTYDVTVTGLQPSTVYSVTLPASAVVDDCDNPLDEDVVFVLEVEDDPCDSDSTAPTFTVSPTPPIELMTGTTEFTTTLGFSEPIEAVAPTVDSGASVSNVTNVEANDWAVTITGLSDGTSTVTIPGSTADVCGNTIGSDFDFDIIVGASDTTPPMVVSSMPTNGASGVALDSNIVFEFSEAMETTAGTIELTADSSPVTFSSAWSNNDRTLTIDPDVDFDNGDSVTVTLDAFADPSGNALPNEVLTFTTLPDPCVFDTTPPAVSSTPVSPITLSPGASSTSVTLDFSESVTGVSAGLSIDRGATISSVTQSGNSYTVSVSNLATGTNRLTAATSITDSCGNALTSPFTVQIESPSLDQTPPSVVSTDPVSGATNVGRSSDILVVWNEPMSQTGAATVRVNSTTRTATATWDNNTTLRIDPTSDLPYGSLVEVRLSGFEDLAGNRASLRSFNFRVEPDPCSPYPTTVTVVTSNQDGILADTSGDAWVLVELDDNFPLQESQLSVTPVTGTGTLAAGSLTGTGRTYGFRLTGTAPGDSYDVAVGTGTQNNGCTTLTSGNFSVAIPDAISVDSGPATCPLPGPAASSFNGGDACDAFPTNDTNATATPTGLTLDAIGDVISISGTYDSDQSSDLDYFAFDVVEDGTTPKDLEISVYHGCNYTSAPSDDDFEVNLEEQGGFTVGSIFYGVPNVIDAYDQNIAAIARAVRTVDGPSGTNTYVLELNEQGGGSWCMDFRAFVEVVDSGRPASCEHTPVSVEIANTAQLSYANEFTGDAQISIDLSNDYSSLTAGDIEVIPLGNARGSLKPGSLSGSGSQYTASLGGVRAGESYLVTLATSSTTCTSVLGSGFYVTITDDPVDAGDSGACPLPSQLPQHHTAADACNASTNDTFGTAEATGQTLTNAGDRFSIGATMDSDSGDDYFAFTIDENGTNIYTFDVTLIYGCNFADSTGTNAPLEFDVLDPAGVVVGTATGNGSASTTGDDWQTATGTFQVASSAGQNTYYLRVKDGGGSGLCIDYIAFMELTDVSGDGACLGRTSASSLSASALAAPESGGVSTVTINLTSGYSLAAGDVSLTPVTGAGTLDATSFNQLNSSTYEVDITGVAVGDEYTLSVTGGTDTCGTTLTGGNITISVQNLPDSTGTCPLPPTLPNNYSLGETCSSTPTNSTQGTAADTGFVLSQPGDAFSISNIYNTSGSDYDWFAFSIDNPSVGTSFELDIRFVYGCGLYGTPSGSSAMDVQLRTPSGSATTDISGQTSYNSIGTGSDYDYGQATRTVTPPSAGLNTYYIWQDDPSGTGFCFDMVTYVTVNAVN